MAQKDENKTFKLSEQGINLFFIWADPGIYLLNSVLFTSDNSQKIDKGVLVI